MGDDRMEDTALLSSGVRVYRPVSSCFFNRLSALLIGANNLPAFDSSVFNSSSREHNSVSSSLNRIHSSCSSIALNLFPSISIRFSSPEHSSSSSQTFSSSFSILDFSSFISSIISGTRSKFIIWLSLPFKGVISWSSAVFN